MPEPRQPRISSTPHSDFTSDALKKLGWAAGVAGAFQPYADSHLPARVCRIDKGGAVVTTADGPLHVTYGGAVLADAAADRSRFPAAGDWVAVRHWPDGRITLDAVLPRRTALIRDSADRTSHGQVVAANIDLVVIVEHLHPDPDLGRIERLLVLAWASGAVPLVVLTKSDLVADPDGMRDEVSQVAVGVKVLAVSVPEDAGLTPLRDRLSPELTLAVVGPSGAGKSTLVNALAGAEVMPIGEVRDRDGKGRHTTTHRELIVLPGGGIVIDTPGVRSVGLVSDAEAIAEVYPEIDELAEQCRFRDCQHRTEPGCAVLAAIESGDLDESRFTRWLKLGREAAYQARRADARLRQQDKAVWKQRTKALRDHYRHRDPG
ncbi:ribosome small subunit-dependent GTPase A [Phytoactinopolyspora alkaliphila]|uniref:Small ribosomal subunit biogenesis GTPase RsgA n=1 Tax=Phytoactinopolyspora alkaliphila TaxID=1783498 RepID=A0A6N9YGX1_9ACTN|nr:ribosome small subunit-dependent GTPase A [Phytoactinopolyspora alkaliphila]NED94158.1 ribosome small subunit-dependent GTPase A [Phytoactinopolyspora alkaliphila]